MGYASYLEDIRDKLTADLFVPAARALDSLERTAGVTPEDLERVRVLIRSANGILVQIDDMLELATDPKVDLAASLREAESERDRLWAQVAVRDQRIRRLEREHHEQEQWWQRKLQARIKEAGDLKRRLQARGVEIRDQDAIIDKMANDDRAALVRLVDHFSPP